MKNDVFWVVTQKTPFFNIIHFSTEVPDWHILESVRKSTLIAEYLVPPPRFETLTFR
jgi:hypothetical protein